MDKMDDTSSTTEICGTPKHTHNGATHTRAFIPAWSDDQDVETERTEPSTAVKQLTAAF